MSEHTEQQEAREVRRKQRALDDVTNWAGELARALDGVRRDAEKALADLQAGRRVYGSYGSGPLGHQAPFDVATYTARLETALAVAHEYATNGEIAAAYVAWKA